MAPLALVRDELLDGRLLNPLGEPALHTRGYFMHVPAAGRDAPAIVALRQWLIAAGRATEREFPDYLGSGRG